VIVGVNHVQITVPAEALEEARRFYVQLLGLKPIERPANFTSTGLWLHAGDFEVHIGLEDGAERWKTRAHIAYEVDDLAAYRQFATDNHLPIKEQPTIEGFERFHTRDPFGNTIEFICRASKKAEANPNFRGKAARA
jgi:catechol 2,3-dioxygenase-like lactoylglutathione lyase family enzyme